MGGCLRACLGEMNEGRFGGERSPAASPHESSVGRPRTASKLPSTPPAKQSPKRSPKLHPSSSPITPRTSSNHPRSHPQVGSMPACKVLAQAPSDMGRRRLGNTRRCCSHSRSRTWVVVEHTTSFSVRARYLHKSLGMSPTLGRLVGWFGGRWGWSGGDLGSSLGWHKWDCLGG